MVAVIMAGGKGTRIREISSQIPKPMIRICEKPILQHQIEVLEKQGIKDVILVIGYLGDSIKEYFGDGKTFGVSIRYIEELEPLGTAGALYFLKDEIKDDFLLINGDIIFDIDIVRMALFHRKNSALATLFTHPNNHPYDSALIVAEKSGLVRKWVTKEEQCGDYKNRVNAGIHIISPMLFKYVCELKKSDLDRDILKKEISNDSVYAYDSTEYVKDMGTPERFTQVENDIRNGLVENRNLLHRQKALFLDRDGTINKDVGYVTNPDQLELVDGIVNKIKEFHGKGYLIIVVTNQPVIARGDCTFEGLENIHNRLEAMLGKQGTYVDDIYFCPHHPDTGFEGEVPELKINCDCRKPNIGMFVAASKKYNIALDESIMVGDGDRDIEAGKKAGCTSIWVDDFLSNK